MSWLLLSVCCIVFVEVVLRLDVAGQARAAGLIVSKATRTIRSPRISDHWKERVLPTYSLRLLTASFRLFATVLLALVPIMLATWLSGGQDSHFLQLALSWPGILGATGLAVAYATVRARVAGK